jgi:hypothetical protein
VSINATANAWVRSPAQVQAALDRALARSAEQSDVGNLPRLIRAYEAEDGQRSVWSVGSRTVGGTIYLVDALVHGDDIDLLCECQSAGWCWHRTHVERAMTGQIPHYGVEWAPSAPRRVFAGPETTERRAS